MYFMFQGPISIFNAQNHWSAPRTVVLNRAMDQGFGFSVRGDCPVKVADIEPGSVAEVEYIAVSSENQHFAYAKTKAQISTSVSTIGLLYNFLKFPASSHLLCLHMQVWFVTDLVGNHIVGFFMTRLIS